MVKKDININNIMSLFSKIKPKKFTKRKPLIWIPISLHDKILREVRDGNK